LKEKLRAEAEKLVDLPTDIRNRLALEILEGSDKIAEDLKFLLEDYKTTTKLNNEKPF